VFSWAGFSLTEDLELSFFIRLILGRWLRFLPVDDTLCWRYGWCLIRNLRVERVSIVIWPRRVVASSSFNWSALMVLVAVVGS